MELGKVRLNLKGWASLTWQGKGRKGIVENILRGVSLLLLKKELVRYDTREARKGHIIEGLICTTKKLGLHCVNEGEPLSVKQENG